MNIYNALKYTAFKGHSRFIRGTLVEVAIATKAALDRGEPDGILVFDDQSGRVKDLDLRGSAEQVKNWAEQQVSANNIADVSQSAPSRGRGRPKLGVVSREITLLPRHWAWLATQRGGASASLRRLIDQERKTTEKTDIARRSQEAAYRFMSAIGGDLPAYEEAIRALFAADETRFRVQLEDWPADVRGYCMRLAKDFFQSGASEDDQNGGQDRTK